MLWLVRIFAGLRATVGSTVATTVRIVVVGTHAGNVEGANG